MSGFNMPPGVSPGDIPGNEPSHRTGGATIDCQGCRYWSEMIAAWHGSGPIKALCLNPDKLSKRGQYTTGRDTCEMWAAGDLGAIDEPGEDPERYRRREEAEAIQMHLTDASGGGADHG